MSIKYSEDLVNSRESHGGSYGGDTPVGLYLIAILLIFFVIIAGLWHRNGERDHGGFGGFPGMFAGMCGNGCMKSTPVEEVAISNIAKEVAMTYGNLKTQAAVDTGAIIHSNDIQTLELEKCIGRVTMQNAELAMAAERREMSLALAAATQRINDQNSQLIKQEIINDNARQSMHLQHQLDAIQCAMLKQPPFVPFGTYPAAVPFRGEFNEFRENRGCGTCC